MAVPFRRVSKTRRDKRRTHDKLKVPAVVVCPECVPWPDILGAVGSPIPKETLSQKEPDMRSTI